MMWDSEPPPVLVGVDPGGHEAALEYAVADAVRRGVGLHVVHVVRPPGWWAGDDADVTQQAELRERGHRLLAEAARRAAELATDAHLPTLPVSTELSQGSAVAVLAALSGRAAVVVLQHHGWSPHGDSSSLSVTAGVAAVALAPVVAVPDRWRPTVGSGRVLAAVEDPLRDRAVLDTAASEARRRGSELVAVQVAGAELDDQMLLPGVEEPVRVVRGTGTVADVLLELADGCDLVVVGRHHRRQVIGAILGRTTRDLVRRLDVPVLVVDPLDDAHEPRSPRVPAAALPGA